MEKRKSWHWELHNYTRYRGRRLVCLSLYSEALRYRLPDLNVTSSALPSRDRLLASAASRPLLKPTNGAERMSLRLTATTHNEPSARAAIRTANHAGTGCCGTEVAVNWEEAGRLAELPPIFPVEVKRRSVNPGDFNACASDEFRTGSLSRQGATQLPH